MLENVIVLKQTLETATENLPAAETEPILPAPETLAAQFNHRLVFKSLLKCACLHRKSHSLKDQT